jgi:hypothetical protein
VKAGTETKLKFKQLQRALRLPLWQARGLLDTIWSFAVANCPAGDIGRFSDDEIAIGIDWQGEDASELIETLVSVRWLDRVNGCLLIHDWYEHCEDSVHKTLARRCELFASGHIPNLTRFTRDERAQLLDQYRDKYGDAAIKAGGVFPGVSKRSETPENAQPCLTLPSHALPDSCVEAGGDPPSTPPPVSSEVDLLEFPCVPGKRGGAESWVLTESHVADLARTFPAVDVDGECRRALAWIKANPTRRKTAGGMADFLFRWMSKEQNSGRRSERGKPAERPLAPDQTPDFPPRRRL